MTATQFRTMRAILAGALVCLIGAPGFAMSPVKVLRWFDGAWSGDDVNLRVDVTRLQANTDPKKPFQWDAFRLVNIAGSMVVFDIGPKRFIALMGEDRSMTLTSAAFMGQRILHRHDMTVAPTTRDAASPKGRGTKHVAFTRMTTDAAATPSAGTGPLSAAGGAARALAVDKAVQVSAK